jgi:hypothetical protein
MPHLYKEEKSSLWVTFILSHSQKTLYFISLENTRTYSHARGWSWVKTRDETNGRVCFADIRRSSRITSITQGLPKDTQQSEGILSLV